MLRAVDVLARMHQAQRKEPPQIRTLDTPAVLQSPRLTLATGVTRRVEVERQLGIAFSYPARGWHTYAVKEETGRCFLSLFYKDGTLIAVELYEPASDRAPALAPVDVGGFTLAPCAIRVGMQAASAMEARFDGGAVYVKASAQTIDRICIYAAR